MLFRSGELAAVVGDTPPSEGGELIMPMETGAEVLAEKLLQKISQFTIPQPAYAMAGGGSNSYAYDNRRSEVHLHVGTLIADDLGLKKLERSLSQFRISEAQRRGDE